MNERATHEQRYVDWLRQESMLADASTAAGELSAVGATLHNPFGRPDPERAIQKAPSGSPRTRRP
jgi:hypothetical protein